LEAWTHNVRFSYFRGKGAGQQGTQCSCSPEAQLLYDQTGEGASEGIHGERYHVWVFDVKETAQSAESCTGVKGCMKCGLQITGTGQVSIYELWQFTDSLVKG
jgi:hypothetical protein